MVPSMLMIWLSVSFLRVALSIFCQTAAIDMWEKKFFLGGVLKWLALSVVNMLEVFSPVTGRTIELNGKALNHADSPMICLYYTQGNPVST